MLRLAIFFGTAAAIWAALYFILEVALGVALIWVLGIMLFVVLGLGFAIFYSGDTDK